MRNLNFNNSMEKWLFISLCVFALGFDVSLAVGNVGLSLAIAVGMLCVFRNRGGFWPLKGIDTGLIKIIAIFFGVTIVSWIAGGDFSREGVANITNQLMFRFAPFLLLPVAIKNKRQLAVLTGMLLISFFVNDAYIIWQGISNWSAFGIARPGGFMNYMYQGGLLCMIVSVLPILWLAAERVSHRNILFLSWLVAVIAAVFNGTRGGWLAAAITLPISLLTISQNKKNVLAGLLLSVCLFGTAVVASPALQYRIASITDVKHNQSNTERLLMWQSAWNMFKDYPVLGIGVGNYTRAYQTKYILPEAKDCGLTHAHSNVMHLLAERGAMGAGSFLLLWGYFIWFGLHGWYKYGHYAYICFFAVVCSFMLQGLTEYNLGSALTSKFLWLTTAMSLRWIELDKT